MNSQFAEYEGLYVNEILDHLDNIENSVLEIEKNGFDQANETVLIRPPGSDGKESYDKLFEYLTNAGCNFLNKTVVLDLTNFKIVPLSMMGWVFLWKENLERENSRLVLTGVDPRAFSPALKKRVFSRFDVRLAKDI